MNATCSSLVPSPISISLHVYKIPPITDPSSVTHTHPLFLSFLYQLSPTDSHTHSLSLSSTSSSSSFFFFPGIGSRSKSSLTKKMQYKNLGRSGLKVSQLSYGAWVSFGNQLDVKEAKALLQCCRDHGVNFFDNAEVYANGRAEEIMGQAIRELGWKRSDIVVSTKIFWGGQGPNDKGLSRKHVVEGTKASLKRLDMEYNMWMFSTVTGRIPLCRYGIRRIQF